MISIVKPSYETPPDAEGIARQTLESIQQQVMKGYYAAIEKRLQDLVNEGIAVYRITLQSDPSGEAQILVDGVPNASFRIGYQRSGF